MLKNELPAAVLPTPLLLRHGHPRRLPQGLLHHHHHHHHQQQQQHALPPPRVPQAGGDRGVELQASRVRLGREHLHVARQQPQGAPAAGRDARGLRGGQGGGGGGEDARGGQVRIKLASLENAKKPDLSC